MNETKTHKLAVGYQWPVSKTEVLAIWKLTPHGLSTAKRAGAQKNKVNALFRTTLARTAESVGRSFGDALAEIVTASARS